MRYFFLAIIISYTVYGNAQKFKGEMPRYLLAENAEPLVMIVAMPDFEGDFTSGEISQPNENVLESVVDERTLYEHLVSSLDGAFRSMSIKPQGYMYVSWSEFFDKKGVQQLAVDQCETLPYYVIQITVKSKNLLKKAMNSKDGFSLDQVNAYGLVVNELSKVGDHRDDIYYCAGAPTEQLAKVVGKLYKNVKSQDDDFYVDYVSISSIEHLVEPESFAWFDKMVNTPCASNIPEWPSEQALKQNKTIVWCDDRWPDGRQRHVAVEAMEEGFPYDYDFPEEDEFSSFYKQKYGYVFKTEKIHYEVERTTTSDLGSFGTRKDTDLEQRSRYYYVIQDVDSGNCYVGDDEEKLRSKGQVNPPVALKSFLKIFNKE